MKKNIYNEQEIQEMIKMYQIENMSLKKIGENFNVSKTVITRVFHENGIDTSIPRRKYQANYDTFENIDSIEKAYWLGFIAADGCNYQREENASIILNIHQKDREQLEKFKIFMNTNAEIKDFIQNVGFSNNTPMCKIVLNSKKMSKDLIDKGVPPKKSEILKPPLIKEEYYLPYILGYFDGDGSISKSSKDNTFYISFLGTYEMLSWIDEILEVNNKIIHTNSYKNNYELKTGGTYKPYAILKKLYDNCPVHLDRKYKLFKTLETVVLSRNAK